MRHAYAVTNKVASLADASFTWGNGASTNRSYLRDGRMDRRFSVGSVASQVALIVDFGVAVSLNAIAILNHNLAQATGPRIGIDSADNSAFTVGVALAKAPSLLTTTAPRQKDHVLQFPLTTKRYWRVSFSWTGTFAMTLGEVFAAETTTLPRAIVYGGAEREEYVGTRFAGYTGETRGHYIAGPIRVRELPFEDLDADERNELATMWRATRGGASPLLWCEQHEATTAAADADHQNVILGRLEEQGLSWTEFDFGRFNPSAFTLRSLAREVGA